MKKLVCISLFLLCGLSVGRAGEAKVGLILPSVADPFWGSVRDGALDTAKRFPDLALSVRAPEREITVEQQTQLIEDETATGTKVIVVAPVDEVGIRPALAEAHARGVRVVVVGSDPGWPDKAAFVGVDNAMGGYAAADYIVKRLNGVGKVAIITGALSNSGAVRRTNGAREAFRMNRGIKLVAVRLAGWERGEAMTEMESLLTLVPDLDAVFCCNDEMALGAAEAVATAGAGTFVVGFDASPEALKAIAQGKLAATVAQDSRGLGRLAIAAGYRLAIGKSVPSVIDAGTTLITADNVKEYGAGLK